MNLYKDIEKLPAFKKPVITIGTFDGVHLGHKIVLNQLIREAREKQGDGIVITFDPHPRHILPSANTVNLLTTPEEKYKMLNRKGIDNIVAVPFDQEFASQSAGDYIKNFLVKRFHPATIITGYDHRFGNNREGDYHLLEKEGLRYGFEVKEIPGHIIDKITISSTRIRESLKEGNIVLANHLLGYNYRMTGTVTRGNQLGRQIGFPTANLEVHPEKLIPSNGVYAVWVGVHDKLYHGMMNIGVRPTVDGVSKTIEVHILDFNKEIYGQQIQVSFAERLRDEIKFEGLDALKNQLGSDRGKTIEILGRSVKDNFSDHFLQ